MKKIISFLICLNIVITPAYGVITDDFVNESLNNIKTQQKPRAEIKDSFVEETLNKNTKIKQKKQFSINDDFATKNTNKNIKKTKPSIIEENLPQKVTKDTQKKIVIVDEENLIPIRIRIKDYYTTKSRNEIQEGDYIEFETIEDVFINKKLYPAGTVVHARIETISMNQAMGVPADLVVGNFNINNILLYGEINKTGANRTLWVYPAMWSTIWFFGAGLVFVFVRGGHAKIKKSEIFTLYAPIK